MEKRRWILQCDTVLVNPEAANQSGVFFISNYLQFK